MGVSSVLDDVPGYFLGVLQAAARPKLGPWVRPGCPGGFHVVVPGGCPGCP